MAAFYAKTFFFKALLFRVRQNTVFSPFAILMFDRAGGSNIFGGAAAGVVRTRTGGSPNSPSTIFSYEKGNFLLDKNHGGPARLW